MALASLGVRSLATGWIAVFAIEVVLYVVGAAFIVLVLAKDRTVNRYKTAAETDPLTEPAQPPRLLRGGGRADDRQQGQAHAPVSVLAFDLDHFKSINDRFGHKTGDAVLGPVRAGVVRKTMRADDVIGRIGGEEFVAILSGKLAEATHCRRARARRLREQPRVAPDSPQIPATVSIGVACGAAGCVDRRADRPRRCRALSRQGERAQPGRARRRDGSAAAWQRPADGRTEVRSVTSTGAGVAVPIWRVPICVR